MANSTGIGAGAKVSEMVTGRTIVGHRLAAGLIGGWRRVGQREGDAAHIVGAGGDGVVEELAERVEIADRDLDRVRDLVEIALVARVVVVI